MDMVHSSSSHILSSSFRFTCSSQLHETRSLTRDGDNRLRLGIGGAWNGTTRTGMRSGFSPTRVLGRPLEVSSGAGNSVRCSAMANSSNSNKLAGRLFGPGDEGENWWDHKCVFHPVVVRDPSTSSWRMYYYGRDGDAWSSGVSPALISTGRVGLALSEDGVHWRRRRGPLPKGAIFDPDEGGNSFDSVHVGCSDMLFQDGQWWMFYFGGSTEAMELRPGAKAVQGFRMLPGLVKSDDGVVFDRKSFTGNPLLNVGEQNEWDEIFVAWPRVLSPRIRHRSQRETETEWLMTYSSIEKQTPPFSSIGIAKSSDGYEWTKLGKVLTRGAPDSWDEGGVGRRHVLLIMNEYVMFYEGVDMKGIHGIGLAISIDGIHWEKDTVCGGPIFTARVGEEAWDNGTVAAPHVVHMGDGSFRMYYVGSNDSKTESAIGMAVSEGQNFRSWTRLEQGLRQAIECILGSNVAVNVKISF